VYTCTRVKAEYYDTVSISATPTGVAEMLTDTPSLSTNSMFTQKYSRLHDDGRRCRRLVRRGVQLNAIARLRFCVHRMSVLVTDAPTRYSLFSQLALSDAFKSYPPGQHDKL
jgi:hypothetical protein